MSRIFARSIAAMAIGAVIAGAFAPARAAEVSGELPCINEEHRHALAADVLLWQIDELAAICIEKYDERADAILASKTAFNAAVERLRQTTYAVVAYQVFHPSYGDDAPKARLKFLTDLTADRNRELKEGSSTADCEDLDESLDIFAGEANRSSFGAAMEGIIAEMVADTRRMIPPCEP